jgi:hypothetical protein
MSLQEYLLAALKEMAARPTLEEIMERAGGRAGGRVGAGRGRQRSSDRAEPPLIVVEASVLATALADDDVRT